ncbi:hypothetical protein JXQ31_01050, partial [candidate division KSB1 bacterium]|nr:hypothetical protein [candidate division KSB1 bacterium]
MDPGTVSKILWHFTGGPKRDVNTDKQELSLKPEKEAYKILCEILESKTIFTSQQHEDFRYSGEIEYLNDMTVNILNDFNKIDKLLTAKVCCLAEIPIQHLYYHSIRYGKFAIGFHRNFIFNNKFNPVFYTLDTKTISREIATLFKEINNFKIECDNIKSQLEELINLNEQKIIDNLVRSNNSNLKKIKKLLIGFQRIMSFFKTFSENEFDTIYCEREWRSLYPLKFNYQDIAMIIL